MGDFILLDSSNKIDDRKKEIESSFKNRRFEYENEISKVTNEYRAVSKFHENTKNYFISRDDKYAIAMATLEVEKLNNEKIYLENSLDVITQKYNGDIKNFKSTFQVNKIKSKQINVYEKSNRSIFLSGIAGILLSIFYLILKYIFFLKPKNSPN